MSVTLNTSLMTSMLSKNLFTTTTSINSTMQRLSTGIRLNSAADNAANLSLSKELESKNSGLSMANNNIQTGVSKLQTYEGYLGGITNNLQRIRDLAVQASNGVYSNSERAVIDAEAQQLLTDNQQVSNQANQEIGGTTSISSAAGLINPVTQLTSAEATAQGYTMITDIAGLQAINSGLGGKYILMKDIDLSSLGTLSQSLIAQGAGFTGEFNGNGYSLSNLNISSTSLRAALFGRTNGATLKNIALINSNVTSTVGYVGGLVGSASNSTIANSYATGSVSGNNSVGGLVGWAYNSTIDNSYATGSASGTDLVGGLVGTAEDSDISNSYATGNVSGSNNCAGGLAGRAITSSTITNSYATGNISGNGGVGGLVGGVNSSSVTNSYAIGSVSGSNDYVGGLAGYTVNNGNISHSYATGSVSGNSCVGGLVGSNDWGSITSNASSGTVTGNLDVGGFSGYDAFGWVDDTNFWNINSSGQSGSAGSAVGMNDAAYQDAFLAQNYPVFTLAAPTAPSTSSTGDLILQVGEKGDANSSYQIKNLDVDLSSYSSISLTSVAGALDAISKMDDAINYISSKRSNVGANINILGSKININSTRQENLLSATSTLKDSDIAAESAKLIKQQICQNITISMLQQSKALQADSIMKLISG